ncbi:hypothetical protein PFMALIP_05625, partial [Plasmodium falciparum MaliPS096_E11]
LILLLISYVKLLYAFLFINVLFLLHIYDHMQIQNNMK